MKINPIQCEVIEVRTDNNICIGLAKTEKGEKYILDGRTPDGNGMCSNAFCALSNAAFIMMSTEKMNGERDGSIDRVCPHGVVTFRLSRSKLEKQISYTQ